MFPWQKDDGEPRFALLLTSLEDGVNVDRAALRQAGVTRLLSVESGKKALMIIGGAAESPKIAVDFIICSGDLSDMRLESFLKELAALELRLPVLLISARQKDLALALSLGAAVALERPYSMNQLCKAVEKIRCHAAGAAPQESEKLQASTAGAPLSGGKAKLATQSGQEPVRAASEASEKNPACPPPACATSETTIGSNQLLWTRQGISLMRQGKLEEARKLLLASIQYDPLDLEAATALARSYQQQGNDDKSQRWLHRAGMICLTAGQPERAEVIFSRLPEKWQGDHELIEAQELLQEGDFDAACEAFINICTSRKGTVLHQLLGRACQFTHSPEECLYEVIDALGRNGYESTARTLAARLLHDRPPREEEHGGFLCNFPRLQEVVAVARFTAQAFRAV